jgi:hypothetical protein
METRLRNQEFGLNMFPLLVYLAGHL